MYYVGIDIAKYKHDCFIFTSEGEIVLESLAISLVSIMQNNCVLFAV